MKKKKKKSLFFSGKKKKKKYPTPLSAKEGFQITVTGIFLILTILLLKNTLITYPSADGIKNEEVSELMQDGGEKTLKAQEGPCGRPEIIQDYIEKNEYSRSGILLKKVKGIVVHYVANPGSTAKENRDYFDNLKNTHSTKASSHFVVGLEGEIIQCIPLDEISYASNQRNGDTISIECCHPQKDGKFNKKTTASVLQLCSWLCKSYGLDSSDVIRHYDVKGKICPLYYVKHEKAWEGFLSQIEKKLEQN